MKQQRKLLLLCGPSGIGKNTLIDLLLKEHPESYSYAISHTSRKPRKKEKNGQNYWFVSKEEFQEGLKKNEFIEHTFAHSNFYGTSFSSIDRVSRSGKICIADVDSAGIESITNYFKGDKETVVKCIGLLPATDEILEKRLSSRKTENINQVNQRLIQSQKDISFIKSSPLVQKIIINFNTWEHGYPLLLRSLKSFFPVSV